MLNRGTNIREMNFEPMFNKAVTLEKRLERSAKKERKKRNHLWRRVRNFRNYKKYLGSKHWQKLSNSIKFERPFCYFCGSKNGLEVHHKRYFDNSGMPLFYRERPRDLVVTCRDCHEKIHERKLNQKLFWSQSKKLQMELMSKKCDILS